MAEAELKLLKKAEGVDDLKEYQEMRNAEKAKELEEIQRLKERREQRRKEREVEERRMAELRQVEEQRRRQDEEERLRRKREEEMKRREAVMRKHEEMMRFDQGGKPNYVIQKRSGDGPLDKREEEGQAHVYTKTKEQLEAEKKAYLAQRCQPLNIERMSLEQLLEKARELYKQLHRLEADKFDLEQRVKKQQVDLQELAERSRQMNKGGNFKVGVHQESDSIVEKYGAPPKITMYSPYERVKDRRTFDDRRELFTGPMYVPEDEQLPPKEGVPLTDGKPLIDGVPVKDRYQPKDKNADQKEFVPPPKPKEKLPPVVKEPVMPPKEAVPAQPKEAVPPPAPKEPAPAPAPAPPKAEPVAPPKAAAPPPPPPVKPPQVELPEEAADEDDANVEEEEQELELEAEEEEN